LKGGKEPCKGSGDGIVPRHKWGGEQEPRIKVKDGDRYKQGGQVGEKIIKGIQREKRT